MSKQPLRGFRDVELKSIADSISLGIKAANDFEDLKRLMRVLEKGIRKMIEPNKKHIKQ